MASWPQKIVRRHSLILYESAELALAAWWTLGAAITGITVSLLSQSAVVCV